MMVGDIGDEDRASDAEFADVSAAADHSLSVAELGFPLLRHAVAIEERPVSRVAGIEDWQDQAWSRFLNPLSSEPAPRADGYDPGTWERVHLLYGLDRRGSMTGSERLLVVATLPDAVIGTLSELVRRVDVFDLTGDTARSGAEARLYWSNGALYARDRLYVHEAGARFEDYAAAYDAVVFPHSSLFYRGVAGMAWLLEAADHALRDGGVIAFKADILAGDHPDPVFLDAGLLGEAGLASRIEQYTGFAVEGGFDARLSARTVREGTTAQQAKLLQWREDRLSVPSLWFLRKREATGADGWRRLQEWVMQRLLGDQLPRLRLGPRGTRDARGRIATSGPGAGRVFFGPYLTLPEGRYEVEVAIDASRAEKPAGLRLEAMAGGQCLDRKSVRPAAGVTTRVRLAFAVASPGGDPLPNVELCAWSDGGEALFTECRLDAIAEARDPP